MAINTPQVAAKVLQKFLSLRHNVAGSFKVCDVM
jgi:hypothetical protein